MNENKEHKDTSCRKWIVTINNPIEKGFDHERIKNILLNVRGMSYWSMCDEIGEKKTYHTHIIFYRNSPMRFSTLKKLFPPADLEMMKGTLQQGRDYIRKEGKYKGTNKEETNLKDTFEESGIVPDENQGKRNDLIALYDMIRDGKSDFEILEENPNYMLNLEKIGRCREILRYEEFKEKRRNLQVEYWYGMAGTGKTRGVLDRYGYSNVYRVTNSRNPWDGYRGQDVVLFDDFRSHMFDITDLLRWLDIYPIELPCRYNDKMACFSRVFFTSNVSFDSLYTYIQRCEPETWYAFCRRFDCIKVFNDGGIIDYQSVDDYLHRHRASGSLRFNDVFKTLPAGVSSPFQQSFDFS